MWSSIISIIPNMLGYFLPSPELKKQKETNKLEIEKTKLEIEKNKLITAAQAESDYDTQAAKNMQTSWKDEYLILLHTLPVYGYVIPSETLHKGLDRIWENLGAAPYEWWVIYIGMVASTFGLRWLFNKQKINKMLDNKGKDKEG